MVIARMRTSLVFAALIFSVLMLTAKIEVFFFQERSASGEFHTDILYNIFGRLREDLAAMIYLKADQYFHGGTRHAPGQENCLDDELMGREGGSSEHVLPSGQAPDISGTGEDLFSGINHAIHDHAVIHISEAKEGELAPWFFLAAKMDPHYVNAYVLGGYWLGTRLGRTPEALSFLQTGLRFNPRAWEIYREIGYVYFFNEKNYPKAREYLQPAYRIMEQENAERIEKKKVLILLAAAAEKDHDVQDAIYYYEKLLALEPGDGSLRDKIQELKNESPVN